MPVNGAFDPTESYCIYLIFSSSFIDVMSLLAVCFAMLTGFLLAKDESKLLKVT